MQQLTTEFLIFLFVLAYRGIRGIIPMINLLICLKHITKLLEITISIYFYNWINLNLFLC